VQQGSWATAKMTARCAYIHGCPENFPESLGTSMATFLKIFNGLLFRLILWMRVQNLKFIAFNRSWNNRGYPKNFGTPSIRPRFLFCKMFNWLLFRWNLWMHRPNLKSVALPVLEIIGDTQKLWAVPLYVHAPFSPKFLKCFCSDGPYECIGQIWSP